MLATDERIEVVGRASDGREAVELARRLRPDVVALDISMPVMDGFEAAAELEMLEPPPGVLILDRVELPAGHRSRAPRGREGRRHQGCDRRAARRGDPRRGRLTSPLLPFAAR